MKFNKFLGGLAMLMAIPAISAAPADLRPAPAADKDGGAVKKAALKRVGDNDEWKSLGTGKYRDNIMHTYRLMGDWYPEWDVEVMESVTNPGRYKIVNPYKNCPYSSFGQANDDPRWCIFVYAEDPEGVMIPDWYAGFDFTDPANEQEGPLMISSQAYDYYENLYGDLEQAKAEGLCGTLKNGAITFNPYALLVQIAPDYEYQFEQWKRTNPNGMWRLKLPGAPDLDLGFDCAFSTDGVSGTVTLNVSMQKDVQKVKMALVRDSDPDAVYQDIISGQVSSTEITESGEYELPVTENGKYTVMLVPYYNDEPLQPVYLQQEYVVADSDWHVCAEKGTFSDGFLYGLEGGWFPWYPSVGQVEVQRSNTEYGLIRIVDPFGPDAYEFANSTNYDLSQKYYMYFHIEDPDKVYIDEMDPIGLDINYGPMEVWCKVMRLKSAGQSEAELEPWWGKLNGNKVTFPKGGTYIKFKGVVDSWYSSNHQESFYLELPSEATDFSGIDSVSVSPCEGEESYYTLQGTKVSAGNLQPGIYIKVSGGKASKTVIRK